MFWDIICLVALDTNYRQKDNGQNFNQEGSFELELAYNS